MMDVISVGLISIVVLVALTSLAYLFEGAKRVKTDESGEADFWGSMRGFAFFVSVIFILFAVASIVLPRMFPDPSDAGARGDMFGGLTALFSGLAFAGFISTLLMQRRELSLQRQELTQTREEFQLQRFENGLFGLLELFNDHVTSLEHFPVDRMPTDPPLKGREVLRYYANCLGDEYYEDYVDHDDEGRPIFGVFRARNIDQARAYVEQYDDVFEPDMGPYFRLLYNTIRLIETSNLEPVEQLRYSKIVRAYLSSAEIKLIMFNCASELGEGFHNWVVKHGLLKHLHPNDAQKNVSMVLGYPTEAFRGRFKDIEHTP